MFIKTKKAQVSLEVIVAVMFIIIFLFIFTQLSNTTQNTIETNHIRVQQNELAYSLNDFFQTVKDVVSDDASYIDTNISYFKVEYAVPKIVVGGQILPCLIKVETNKIEVFINYKREIKKGIYGLDLKNIEGTFSCGQTITCEKSEDNVFCS